MNLSSAYACMLFEQLGFDIGSEGIASFPIEEVRRAAMRGLNGPADRHTEENKVEERAGGATILSFGVPEGYMVAGITQLIDTGRRHGATHVTLG